MRRRHNHFAVARHKAGKQPSVLLGQRVKLLKVQPAIVVVIVHFEYIPSYAFRQTVALVTANQSLHFANVQVTVAVSIELQKRTNISAAPTSIASSQPQYLPN